MHHIFYVMPYGHLTLPHQLKKHWWFTEKEVYMLFMGVQVGTFKVYHLKILMRPELTYFAHMVSKVGFNDGVSNMNSIWFISYCEIGF
jgi:hypothetical protein